MPRYDYSCCSKFEKYAEFDRRDSVTCGVCGKLASRMVAQFAFLGASYVGTKRFQGAELALGVKGIESTKELSRAMKEAHVEPVDAYYRKPELPKPKEVTIEELAPYLDGMPL